MKNSPLHPKLRLAAAVSLSGLVLYTTAAATVRAAPPAKKAVAKTATPKPTSQTNFTDNTPLTFSAEDPFTC